jgi:hypothetical protein
MHGGMGRKARKLGRCRPSSHDTEFANEYEPQRTKDDGTESRDPGGNMCGSTVTRNSSAALICDRSGDFF